MDRHDEEFETFLRQFRLRKVRPLPEIVSIKRRSSIRWGVAAAAAVVVGVLSMSYFRNVDRVTGPKATIAAAGNPSLYKTGEVINAGNVIRSNSAEGLMLALTDGSQIEMHSQSELALEPADDGIRVKLNDGSILVTAAKQRSGHLYVQTRDALVSVVGTVFFVSAERAGTRVGVVEGEVQITRGETLNKLHPGEQVATNSSLQMKSVAEEIAWSRSASQYAATLSQFAPPSVSLQERPATSPVPFKVETSYTKQEGDEVRALITVEILTRDLVFRSVNGVQRAEATITGEIYRSDNRRIPGFSYPLIVEFPSQRAVDANLDKPNLFRETRFLLPGSYNLHLTVEDKNSGNVKVSDYALAVPRLSEQTTPTLFVAEQSDPTRDDSGRMIFNRACTTCHSANAAASGNYTTKYAYETLIARERGFGAMLSDAEVPLLVDYLFNTFGKKSAPPEDLPVQRK